MILGPMEPIKSRMSGGGRYEHIEPTKEWSVVPYRGYVYAVLSFGSYLIIYLYEDSSLAITVVLRQGGGGAEMRFWTFICKADI